MKIHLANYQERVGGGWSFLSNFKKGLEKLGYTPVAYEEADTYFIAGCTMVTHDDVDKAKADGKRIVLRIDNAVRNSRNRGTGMTRMKAFAEKADLVIYQSKWAKGYLQPFLQRDGAVVLNGIDTSVFNPYGRARNRQYVYIRSSRDETKNWEMARYWFSRKWQTDQEIQLNIVGKFSSENLEYNFDFYQGEKFRFLGEQPPTTIADILRSSTTFLYSYYNDACSNTLIEAIACGCRIIDVEGMLLTGGAPEIMDLQDLSLERMTKQYLEVLNG